MLVNGHEVKIANVTRPVFVYDGQCGFCRCWVSRWRHSVGDRVDFSPFQEVAEQYPQIGREAFSKAAHLIEPDGRVSRGAEAVFRTFATAKRKRWLLWAYQRVPGVAKVAEAGYGFVARNRPLVSKIIHCSADPTDDPRGMNVTRWAFLRALGVIYLLAFGSLQAQLLGLIGSDGIVPAQELLKSIAAKVGDERFHLLPTLCWIDASDAFLQFLCVGGMVLSGLLILDVAPAVVLFLLWAFYLSLSNVGNVFLQFQWDALLLETGLLAIFLAPLYVIRRRGRVPPGPSWIAVWLLRWLLIRLMFLSGAVKLGSGDETWRNLTALTVHYETQPLSNWVAWHFHQLPLWFHKFSCGLMFTIELVCPFLILLGRWGRRVAFGGFVFLQLCIILTGNYGFFNFLTLALCILLLDDGFWPNRMRRWFGRNGLVREWRWPGWLMTPLGAVVIVLTLMPALRRLGVKVEWPTAATEAYRFVSPANSFNSYGLFAAMTHSRPEIVVEGSDDGSTWKAYEFRYKPGDPMRAPPFVAPHMPRLDWQMWFAALSNVNEEPWFVFFCKRLLEGSPSVLGLIETNPFPDRPPRYVRAMLYDYRFTDKATHAANGRWWRRELQGVYCPPLDLKFFRRRRL